MLRLWLAAAGNGINRRGNWLARAFGNHRLMVLQDGVDCRVLR
jgi:hypothetical protein